MALAVSPKRKKELPTLGCVALSGTSLASVESLSMPLVCPLSLFLYTYTYVYICIRFMSSLRFTEIGLVNADARSSSISRYSLC